MRPIGYTWFRTHTTLVALFVVQIRVRVEAHLVEQFESELGVVVSSLAVPWPHLPLSFIYSVISIQTRYPLCYIFNLVSDLHRILEALVYKTKILGVIYFSFRISYL